jgi:hypothetical protein
MGSKTNGPELFLFAIGVVIGLGIGGYFCNLFDSDPDADKAEMIPLKSPSILEI